MSLKSHPDYEVCISDIGVRCRWNLLHTNGLTAPTAPVAPECIYLLDRAGVPFPQPLPPEGLQRNPSTRTPRKLKVPPNLKTIPEFHRKPSNYQGGRSSERGNRKVAWLKAFTTGRAWHMHKEMSSKSPLPFFRISLSPKQSFKGFDILLCLEAGMKVLI